MIALLSCTGSHYTEQLDRVDSLKMVLDETELTIDEIDIDSLQILFDTWKMRSDEIKKYYIKKSEEDWKIICRYTDMKKPFRSVVEYYDNIIKEIEFTKHQLDSLRKDIESDVLTEELINKYLAEEEKAVNYLNDLAKKNLTSAVVLLNDFDSLDVLAEKVIEDIKK